MVSADQSTSVVIRVSISLIVFFLLSRTSPVSGTAPDSVGVQPGLTEAISQGQGAADITTLHSNTQTQAQPSDILLQVQETSYWIPYYNPITRNALNKPVAGAQEDLVFEARIAPAFSSSFEAGSLFIGVSAIPKIIVRMDKDHSKRVPPPSYMPKGTIFLLPKTIPHNREFLFASLTVGHHSNGQQGAFYLRDTPAQVTTDSGSAELDELVDPQKTKGVNYLTGNFGTNFVQATVYCGMPGVPGFPLCDLSVEYHPKFMVSEKKLREQGYPRLRFHLGFSTQMRGLMTLETRVSYLSRGKPVPGAPDLGLPAPGLFKSRNWVIDETMSLRLSKTSNFSEFVNVYYGEDYYNVRFNNTLKGVRLGLMGDPRPAIAIAALPFRWFP